MTIPLVAIHQSAVAASHSGSVVETVLATVTIPALAANDQVRVGFTCSRPVSQVAEATVLARFNSNLAARWRIGTGRGGAIGPEPVITNRNSTSSQLLGVDASNDGLILTATEDTTEETELTLSVVLGNAADSFTLEQLTVLLASSGVEVSSDGNLALLSTLKTRLNISASTDDAILTNFLELATGIFERHCNRKFARSTSATDEFDADQCELNPSRPPVESVTSFELKSNETDGWETQSGVDYILRKTTGGAVISLSAPLGTWRQRVRVTYTGGYVLPGGTVGAGQTALPDEIEHACVEQVVFWYQNRTKLGLSSASSGGGGSIAFDAKSVVTPLALLPQVQAALRAHVRWNP